MPSISQTNFIPWSRCLYRQLCVPPVRLHSPCAATSRPQHGDSLVTVGLDRRLGSPFGKKCITCRRFSACRAGRFCSGGGRPRSWFHRGYGWPRCRHDLSDKRNGSPAHFNRPRTASRIRLDRGSSISTVRWPAVRQETDNAPQHYENEEVVRHFSHQHPPSQDASLPRLRLLPFI